jgi:predicted permease
MLQDLRFALRLLRRHRGYATVAILTVALGVGANTAVFSIADSVLFRPLPFAAADRLFVLRIVNVQSGQAYGTLPGAAIEAARDTGLFDAMGAAPAQSRTARAYIRRGGGLDALTLAEVSRGYLDMLGVRPVLGRSFDASDAGTRAVMLAHHTWIERFGGDPAIVDRSLASLFRSTEASAIPDPPLRVVGVLPPRPRLPLVSSTADGLALMDNEALGGTGRLFSPLVRLKPGVASGAAQARLEALRVPEVDPGTSALRLVPIRDELAGRQDPVLWLLLGASGIVLLVACVNLANLILARGSARGRELSIRTALGGTRRRLIRLLAIESACIAAFGAAAGLLVAYWAFTLIAVRLPPQLASVVDPALDVRALIFALGIAAVSAAAFGILPAWRLSRARPGSELRLGEMQLHPPRRGRQVLVALEIAICFALLVGAGLVGRSLIRLLSQDLGFQRQRVVATFDLPTLVTRGPNGLRADRPARAAFVRARLIDIRGVAGVRAAGAVSSPPYGLGAPDAPLFDKKSSAVSGAVYGASSGYFRAMAVRLLAGRELTDEESFSAAPVGVLDESAARIICGGVDNCVGRVVYSPMQPPRTVVGVVRDMRRSLSRTSLPSMYVPFDLARFITASIVIDADDTPESREGLKRALSVTADARVEVRSLDAARDKEASPYRFNAIVVGAFGLLTLALSIVGVYGVMSATIGERTREYGIRLALGATRERINTHVLAQAAAPLACGIIGGVALAAWGGRLLTSLLFGIVPLDTASFVAATIVVLFAGLGAAWIPARRAGRVDPIVALRAD